MALSAAVHAETAGTPFRVNKYTPGNQYPLKTVMNANGETIVLYGDAARGGFSFMQRYDQAGRALQSDDWFLQTAETIAIDGAGNFVTGRAAPDGSGRGVFITLFSRAGNIVVPEFRVNDTTAGDQVISALAVSTAGEIAVTWESYTTNNPQVFVKRFRANGSPIGPEVRVGNPGNNNFYPHIAIDGRGNFVVAWTSQVPRTGIIDIWAQRFGSDGRLLGSSFLVNTFTNSTQEAASVAMNELGNFVITWTSYSQEGNDLGIYGQLFDSTGRRLGSELHINVLTSGDQRAPSVAMADDGSFTVTWLDYNRVNEPSAPLLVYARSFDRDGVPRGDQFMVSTVTASVHSNSQISMDRTGYFLITWTMLDNTTDQSDVYAQRYLPEGIAVQPLTDGVVVNDLAGAAGNWQFFKLTVPAGKSALDIVMAGPTTGDADLYVRYGALPTPSIWDARPFFVGSNEGIRALNPPAGDYYIAINGFDSYSSVSLQVTTSQ